TNLKTPNVLPPTHLRVKSNESIEISWDAAVGTDSYNIKRSTSTGGPYELIASNITSTNYLDMDVTSGTTYYYVVSSVNNEGESENSDEISAITIPITPSGLILTKEGTSVKIKWNDSMGAEYYTIKRSETPNGPYEIIASDLTETSYIDENIVNGATYYYVVSALNSVGESQNSIETSVVTVLLPPSGLIATTGEESVYLNWDKSMDAESYIIKRSETISGPYITIESGFTSNQYIDTNVTIGTTYYYVVSAVNRTGESDHSEEVSITSTLYVPNVPSVIVSAGDGTVKVDWDITERASIYIVKRSTTSGGPYTVIANDLTTTSYIDHDVINGTTYFYVVSAINISGESEHSVEVMTTPENNGLFFGSFIYEYDDEERLTSLTLPDGRTIRYEYDQNGNLKRTYVQE
ncbi:fibronectin type III domain-containing protein, partial [Chengkuizengella marina]|nr:hypothetical protein [Chengkuizengella marina]